MAGYAKVVDGGKNKGGLGYVTGSSLDIYEYVVESSQRNSFCYLSATSLAPKLAWSSLSFK